MEFTENASHTIHGTVLCDEIMFRDKILWIAQYTCMYSNYSYFNAVYFWVLQNVFVGNNIVCVFTEQASVLKSEKIKKTETVGPSIFEKGLWTCTKVQNECLANCFIMKSKKSDVTDIPLVDEFNGFNRMMFLDSQKYKKYFHNTLKRKHI